MKVVIRISYKVMILSVLLWSRFFRCKNIILPQEDIKIITMIDGAMDIQSHILGPMENMLYLI